jgi:hypothetical protein
MVSYLDRTWGRATLLKLMGFTRNREVLEALALTEKELLDRWKADLASTEPAAGAR